MSKRIHTFKKTEQIEMYPSNMTYSMEHQEPSLSPRFHEDNNNSNDNDNNNNNNNMSVIKENEKNINLDSENEKNASLLQSDFAKYNYINSCNSSFNSFKQGGNSKILSGLDFKNELKRKYIQSKCTYVKEEESIFYDNKQNFKELLQKFKALSTDNKNLIRDLELLKQENLILEQYRQKKEEEQKKNKSYLQDECVANKLIQRYRQMIEADFNFFCFLYGFIQNPKFKIKDNLEHYVYNESDHNNLIDNFKMFILDLVKYVTELNSYEQNFKEENKSLNDSTTKLPHKQRIPEKDEDIYDERHNRFIPNTYPNQPKEPYDGNKVVHISPLRKEHSKTEPREGGSKSKSSISKSKSKSKSRSKRPSRDEQLVSTDNIFERIVKNNNENKTMSMVNIIPLNSKKNNSFYCDNCFACNAGCNISNSGYSAMTYSPYGDRRKRKPVTPIKGYNS